MASTSPESPSTLVREAGVEASFGCILRLKNAVNDEFLKDFLRKVMKTVFFNGEIKFDMSQEECARFILDELVALAQADMWFLRNQVDKKGKQLLKQWALSALAAIAKSSQVSRVLHALPKFCDDETRGESNGLLLSATISCMTAIWTVIGKDKFSDDTQQAVQLLASTPISNLDIQGLRAWGRLCKCLGQKFHPYMEVAIPCLLQSARLTLPDDANIEESDDER
ncbi:hypothetical protein OIU85_000862 [Salix viminalis]|uniref:Interferon-related developmental regulator N-terminal domain-containing protein n=1 Tax=Salix viminalis TaxID=40686 RepID=A0A9Q0VKE7_SALVM|nr:hypothetical protein OIU85_000862 [Salix viminalis]